MANILLMDDDRVMLEEPIDALRGEHHKTVQAYSLSETKDYLEDPEKTLGKNGKWDLLILDVMMNVSKEEESEYPPERTDEGRDAGLHFYIHNKDLIDRTVARGPLVLTLRGDARLKNEFIKAEMPANRIIVKMAVSDVSDFLEKVRRFLSEE